MTNEDLELARAKRRALDDLARPISRPRWAPHDYGDGDPCPLQPVHGRMWVLSANRQYCSHHNHDRDGTRAFWPLHGVAEALAAHLDAGAAAPEQRDPLPEIDTGGLTW